MNKPKLHTVTMLMMMLATALATCSLWAAEKQGAYIADGEDDDADQVIVMETDWINMHLMPAIGSTVIRFVFRPTQNEVCEITQPKNLKSGGGLLQDNVWEQDWRFQELRGKWYDYQITKRGPDEVQVVFETQLEGWLTALDSGIKSKLLQNLKIRRTVTLKQGTPYFLFEVEFINPDKNTKLPLYWCHNSSRINMERGDHVFRPSDLGINELPTKHGSDYVYNANHGWSARVSPERREGVVYLMDYDYLYFLYNCRTDTTEWVYDNLLVPPSKPVKTKIYIIPIMGLESVDHATEYFIVQLKPTRDKDRVRLQYKATSSYKKARKVTLVPELHYDLLGPTPKKVTLDALEFDELGLEPITREVAFDGQSTDPLKIRTTAFVDLADGTQVKQVWETFHVGDYDFGRNIRRDMSTPVVRLEKPKKNPHIPPVPKGIQVNRKDFNIFAVLGNNGRLLHLEEAMRSIPGVKLEAGYHPGFVVYRTGLTDFPYDYDRLFNYRVVVFHNALFDPARYVGMTIVNNYLRKGGGLVYGGGEHTFGLAPYNDKHPIYDFLPFAKGTIVKKETARLNSPAKGHAIFRGVDLSNLPYQYYVQKVAWKKDLPVKPKVLLKVGADPLIVEYNPVKGQRTLVVLAIPLGDKRKNPGKPHINAWKPWRTLYANIVRYAGHGPTISLHSIMRGLLASYWLLTQRRKNGRSGQESPRDGVAPR
jgi:hypothetical protein